ncbi:LOW QUALITY PROTEIN: putative hypothetical protein [Schistosoma mansoni]|uniref:putative hypothetical protein n=1 Tax=Schistosoma mansoni TaxID=6183 RepID=UPI00022DC98D|nr:LOW QUALITY PROTEIN: putative hypothetical protein [Schistosoma mansoni]|eukprot:XP_018654831.1 LOW QUALITY PROTEIN: putative hypothetical protein [Schistosoma mansoni]
MAICLITVERNDFVFPGLFEGLFGGGLISFTAQISACLADITVQPEDFNENSNTSGLSQQYTSKEHRWLFFTMYDSLASLSHACGSLFGGMVVHRLGFGVSIIICLALYITSVVGLSILPETNQDVLKRRRNPQNNAICQYSESRYSEDGLLYLEIKKNTFIIKMLEIFIKMLKAIQHSSPLSRIVMTLFFSVSVTVVADLQYIYIYLMGCPFFWNAQTVGLYACIALSACLSITFTVAIYNWEQTRILQLCSMGDTKEYVAEYNSMEITSKEIRILFMITTVIFIGFGFMLINKILMGIAFLFTLPTANYIVYGASAVRLVKNTLIAPIRTMISIITPNDKQGFILSLGAFISFVGFLINLTVFPLIYAGTVHVFPGAVFFMCGILITITIGFGVCAIDEGLSYDTKDGKFELIANNESDKLLLKEGQRRAAWIGSCNHSVRLLLGLLTTMIIGYISDRFGRRLSLGIMIIGEALQIITLSVIVLLQANPWLTIIPGLFDGIIGGGLLSIQAQVSASLTDLVSKESVDSNDVTNSQVTNQNNLWTLFTWFDGLALISLSLSNPIGATIPRFAKGLNNPILRTLISMWTDQSKQGMMHSFVAFVSRLGVLICFSVLILIYSSTTHLFPGAVFLVCSSLILIALITTGFLYGLTNTSVDIGQMENTSENMKYTNQIS